MLGSLIAQGLPLEQAVAGAVWLHGAAADALVMNGIGPIGLTAGELADAARTCATGARLLRVAPPREKPHRRAKSLAQNILQHSQGWLRRARCF